MGFINLCLRFPNLDTIAFFLVFVVGLPYHFLANRDLEALQYYLPTLVMLSVTLTEAGKPKFFNNLYPTEYDFEWSYCRYFWECHIKLPEINISLLEKLVEQHKN